MSKKLSIVTVCFNSEKTIERTIQSVLSQKSDEVEYIIVDGLSTDKTIDIVNKYKENIDFVISEEDEGISDAFNKGISRSSGEFVGLINSDDFYLPWAFETFFKNVNSNTDVFYGNGIRLYSNGMCKDFLSDKDYNSLYRYMSLVHPATFVKRSAYERIGMYSLDYKCAMDRELLLKMLVAGCSFQYDDSFYSVYSMGGMSDKNFVKVAIPENDKINKSVGCSLLSRIIRNVKSIAIFSLVELREILKLDKKRIPFDKKVELIQRTM